MGSGGLHSWLSAMPSYEPKLGERAGRMQRHGGGGQRVGKREWREKIKPGSGQLLGHVALVEHYVSAPMQPVTKRARQSRQPASRLEGRPVWLCHRAQTWGQNPGLHAKITQEIQQGPRSYMSRSVPRRQCLRLIEIACLTRSFVVLTLL